MKYTITFEGIDLSDLFEKALVSKLSNDIILELRRIIKAEITQRFIDSGLKILNPLEESISAKLVGNKYEVCTPIKSLHNEVLDIEFCGGYGATYSSHKAINYLHGLYNDIPSLYTFSKCINYSIGNLLLFTENTDAEICIIPSEHLKIVGYSYDISKKKKKSFIAVLGIHFLDSALQETLKRYQPQSDKLDLLEVRFGYTSYPIMFASKYSGNIYACNCFKDLIDWQYDFYRSLPNIEYYPEIKKKIDQIEYLPGLCHLCTQTIPAFDYGNSMYYSGFLQKHLPYQRLEYKKRFGSKYHFNEVENAEIENELRVYFGYAKIGEQWTSETTLYKLVCDLFRGHKVIFHYRGKELNGLEIDIWIPDLNLGFEYQGEQHFHEIKHWGGKAGLDKRIENDKRKKDLCKGLNYHLVEVFYNDELSKESIIMKLTKQKIPLHGDSNT